MLKKHDLLTRGCIVIAIGVICGIGAKGAIAEEMSTIGDINSLLLQEIHTDAIVAYGDTEEARKYFLEKYLATLPQEYDEDSGEFFYFVEGDIFLSREQVERYLEDLAGGSRANDKPGELLVNIYNGNYDYWRDPAKRKMRYAVDYNTFRTDDDAEKALRNFQTAAADWVAACPECGITFDYLSPQETEVNFKNVKIVLRFKNDPDPQKVARSFFPHEYPAKKELMIYPQYYTFSDSDTTGVMRHELGHILGYRHEHTRQKITGCKFENWRWVPLTPSYDPTSIMHYFCGAGGPPLFQLSQVDIRGHRCLYLTGEPCPSN